MAVTTMRLLLRIGFRCAWRKERVALVPRPRKRTEAREHGADSRPCARVDDVKVLDFGTLRVDTDSKLRRIPIRHDLAELGLARWIERDRIEQQDFPAVESRVKPRLRLAFLRPLEEFAPMLEKRRIGLVAIEIARELILKSGDRRRRAVEIRDCRRVLRARPRLDRWILAVLEPAVPIGQRNAEEPIDDRLGGCFGRKERGLFP